VLTILVPFFVALVLAAFLTPLSCRLAVRVGAVSVPGGRNVHAGMIPRLGGLAVATSALLPTMGGLWLRARDDGAWTAAHLPALGVLAGAILVCAVGAWDDIKGLRVRNKLIAQILAALLAFKLGVRIDGISLPLVGALPLEEFALPATVLWIVAVTNAVNLIDGLDGLAVGVVFFAALVHLGVTLLSGDGSGATPTSLTMSALLGSLLGFLFYNFNPARVFLGDSGSYFLGFTLASSALLPPIQKASTAVSLLVPMLALGLPIFDTTLSMVRRYLAKQPLWGADRGHIHHRLLGLGITHRRAVLTLYAVTAVLATAALAAAVGKDWQVGSALVAASVALVGLVRAAGYFRDVHGLQAPEQAALAFVPTALQSRASPVSLDDVREGMRWLCDNGHCDNAQVLATDVIVLHEVGPRVGDPPDESLEQVSSESTGPIRSEPGAGPTPLPWSLSFRSAHWELRLRGSGALTADAAALFQALGQAVDIARIQSERVSGHDVAFTAPEAGRLSSSGR